MYSIFSCKSRKFDYLPEGEPPPKKIVTERDILVKELAQNQLDTRITLAEQLTKQKTFVQTETCTDITGVVRGKTDLQEFQTSLANVDEMNTLKNKGLSEYDIQIYRDYINSGPGFWTKYKDVNRDALQKQLDAILYNVSRTESENIASTSKHDAAGPMDEMRVFEKELMNDIEKFSKCDVKKIRKKARALGNKIQALTDTGLEPPTTNDLVNRNKNLERNTLWDMKQKPEKTEAKIINTSKVYSCKPQNLYTIEDGKIVKLNPDKTLPKKESCGMGSKLTIEDIKKMPKFASYEAGKPSKTLFLKNLGPKVTENFLKNLLTSFPEDSLVVKVMSGKMRGQAFVEFHDEAGATVGLKILNGVLVDGKPIIAQYGKQKSG